MADWSVQSQPFNRDVIAVNSSECCGAELRAMALATGNAAWPTANKAIYIPFVVYQPFLAKLIVVSNGASVTGNIDAGIYDTEGNKLISKGSTAASGTNVLQSLDITDTTLLPGVYYMAFAASSGSHQVWGYTTVNARFAGAMGCLSQTSAFALPSTATFAACSQAIVPHMAIHGRTVL